MSDPFGDKIDPLVKAMRRADERRWQAEIDSLTAARDHYLQLTGKLNAKVNKLQAALEEIRPDVLSYMQKIIDAALNEETK